MMRKTLKILLGLGISFLAVSPTNLFAATLLSDDFSGDIVSSTNWLIPTWVSETDGTYIGRTQFRCAQNATLPAASNSNAILTVDTYNPTGFSFYGTDLIANQSYPLAGNGIHIKVRAKMDTASPGIVGGIFLYALKPGETSLHDEIDFEFLTSLPDQVQTNVYSNEPLGDGHPQAIPYPSGSMTDYHTYEIKWQPDEVSWFIDGNLVRTETNHVPTGPMNFHLNIWVPDTDWTEAFSPLLQPTPELAANQIFGMRVDSVDIQSIPSTTRTPNLATLLFLLALAKPLP